jgi:putative membrane protein
MRLTESEHERVSAAVAAAERGTSGELVLVVAPQSDRYHDVALHYAVAAMLLLAGVMALRPDWLAWLATPLHFGWSEGLGGAELVALMLAQAVTFLLVRLVLARPALRLALTPMGTKARRVRRQALALFRSAVEQRTVDHTGVLLYLSLAEHRAELIADSGIHHETQPEQWGEAMVALIDHVRAGRLADGMVEAVAQVGAILAAHHPPAPNDRNELPDRLIEL